MQTAHPCMDLLGCHKAVSTQLFGMPMYAVSLSFPFIGTKGPIAFIHYHANALCEQSQIHKDKIDEMELECPNP